MDANLQKILDSLRTIMEDGNDENIFLVFADRRKNYFIQFATSYGETSLFGEAVSNEYLEAPNKLTSQQMMKLAQLGWKPPNPPETLNFYREWEHIATDEDRLTIAKNVLQTLKEIYDFNSKSKLEIEVSLTE